MTEKDFIAALRGLATHPGSRGLLDDAAVIEVGGATLVQLRDKKSSTREMIARAQEINAAAQKMNQLTHQMSEAEAEQRRGGEMVVKAVEAIAVVSRQNLVAVEQMTGAAKNLAGVSDALRQRVAVFQV